MTKEEIVDAIHQRTNTAAFQIGCMRLGEIRQRLETFISINVPSKKEQAYWMDNIERYIMDAIRVSC